MSTHTGSAVKCPLPGPVLSVLSQRSLQSAKLWKPTNGSHPMLSLQAAERWRKIAEHSAPAQPQQISSSTILPQGCAAFCAPPPGAPSRLVPSPAQTQTAATVLPRLWLKQDTEGAQRAGSDWRGAASGTDNKFKESAHAAPRSIPAETDRMRHHAAPTLIIILFIFPCASSSPASAFRGPQTRPLPCPQLRAKERGSGWAAEACKRLRSEAGAGATKQLDGTAADASSSRAAAAMATESIFEYPAVKSL